MKIEEQVNALQEYVPIAVGTPHRLNQLADFGALSFSNTKLVILDAHRDDKGFCVVTLPVVAGDFLTFYKSHLLVHLKATMKITVF